MSINTQEKLKTLTELTGGKINNQIIQFAKDILFSRISFIVTDQNLLTHIKQRISDIKIELLSSEDFKETFYKSNGKGFLPGGFVYNGTIYFTNDLEFNKTDFHYLIHEMLHAISENEYKHGLLELSEDRKGYRGYTINEACTEYLTSVLLEESFQGYSKDLNYMIQLLMNITDIRIPKLMELYILPESWLTEDIIKRFNSNNEDLILLVLLYDQRLIQTRNNPYDSNKVIKILIEAIFDKLNLGCEINCAEADSLLRNIYNYYYGDGLYVPSIEIKQKIAKLLDDLGEYKISKSNNDLV